MKVDLSYEDIVDICLSADGGYCGNCAAEVAVGFGRKIKDLHVGKVKRMIDNKMDKYYEK